nr:transposase [Ruegeria halocynthiae]
MPHKFNDARRDKFPKAKYRVTNCSEYNESLRRRGDVAIWISDYVVQNWTPPVRKTRGGQARYSDLAIEIVCVANFGLSLTRTLVPAFVFFGSITNRYLHVRFDRLSLPQGCGFVRSVLLSAVYGVLSRFGRDHDRTWCAG